MPSKKKHNNNNQDSEGKAQNQPTQPHQNIGSPVKPNKGFTRNQHKNKHGDNRLLQTLLGIAVSSLVVVVAILAYVIISRNAAPVNTLNVIPSSFSDMLPDFLKDMLFSKVDHGAEYINYPFVKSHIPRIMWSSEEDFSKIISDRGQPVILKNTTINKWRAKRLWNPKYISENTETFLNVQKHPNKTFSYFHEDHPMSKMEGIADSYKRGTYERVNMSSKEFFDLMDKTPPYFYYAASANELGRPYNDLFPIESLMVKNSTWTADKSYLHRWTNVWFGPAGATTHNHYDISHNFYAQLYGKKRFILFPPEEYKNLYLYPFLHPGAQQSQVSLDDPNIDLKSFPNFKNAVAYDAILEPGDVLYLPPLWFHHVVALTHSMSVSVWTRYPETISMYGTVRSSLPFERSWNKTMLVTAGKLYLRLLLDSLDGEGSTASFVSELVETRYQHLIDTQPNFLRKDASFCANALLPVTEEELYRANKDTFDAFIEKQVQLFSSVPSKARRNIWLGNLCEQLALTVAGLESVPRFLVDLANC